MEYRRIDIHTSLSFQSDSQPRLVKMAKRLNKRQQRELEELRELEAAKVELQTGTQDEPSESDAESVTQPAVGKKFNPFAAVSSSNDTRKQS